MGIIDWIRNEASIIEASNPSKDKINALTYLDGLTRTMLFNENIDTRLQLIDYLKKSINRTPFTSIDLSNDNFEESKNITWGNGILEHKRCPDIFKIKGEEGVINGRAYGYVVRHQYDDKLKQELPYTNNDCDWIFPLDLAYNSNNTIKLFISKGGIVNGDYIDFCYIKSNDKYLVRDSIKIPVSIIGAQDNEMFYTVVDYREPKLKALMEFYDCPIKHIDIHFNIRSYGKL